MTLPTVSSHGSPLVSSYNAGYAATLTIKGVVKNSNSEDSEFVVIFAESIKGGPYRGRPLVLKQGVCTINEDSRTDYCSHSNTLFGPKILVDYTQW